MNDVTRLLAQIEQGDLAASEQLMPVLYEALRRMAAQQLAREKPNQTLQPTALVHEAYLRLVGNQHFESRGHFFMAASRAMRQILIDIARRKKRVKHGGHLARQDLDLNLIANPYEEELLALDAALELFASEHPRRAQLVELRYFGGMTLADAAEALGISLSSADRDWKYARAWLYAAMKQSQEGDT